MKLLKLIIKNALRHKLRTSLTMLGIAFAVMAFGLIQTFIASWFSQAELAAPDRLITRHAVSLVFDLPLSHREQILRVDGVEDITYANWFGGIYKDPQNFFAQFAVDHTNYFELYPEFIVPPDQLESFLNDRRGVIVGRTTADRFDWMIGEQVTLIGTIYPGDWDFIIRGIYTGKEEATDESMFLMRWDYLDETMKQTMPGREGRVGWFGIKIEDPSRAAEISVAIDERFANSWAETLTETEKAFQLSWIAMVSSIIVGLKIISVLIIGVILMVLANTMTMTARERTNEFAFMKTLGFRSFHLIGLIVGESIFIALVGGVLGLFLMVLVAKIAAVALAVFLPSFAVPQITFVHAMLIAVLVGVVASIFPIKRAISMAIVDGLRVVD